MLFQKIIGTSMLANFVENGSWLSVVLAEYVTVMMLRIGADTKRDPERLNTPGIIHNLTFTIVMFLSIPLTFWIAVYIGFFEGFWTAFIAWFLLQIIGTFIINLAINITPAFPGKYAILAILSIPAIVFAYGLSIYSSLKWFGYLP